MKPGRLAQRVQFQRRGPAVSDGAGGDLGEYVDVFSRRAEFVHIRGGETVLAARLQGTHTQIIRVRADSSTLAITPEWRVVDTKTLSMFNITDISPLAGDTFLDLLCQSGGAA